MQGVSSRFRLFDESVPVFDIVPCTHVAGLGVRSSFRWTKRHQLPALHSLVLLVICSMEDARSRNCCHSDTAPSCNLNKEVDLLFLQGLIPVRLLLSGFSQGCRCGFGLGVRCRLSPFPSLSPSSGHHAGMRMSHLLSTNLWTPTVCQINGCHLLFLAREQLGLLCP